MEIDRDAKLKMSFIAAIWQKLQIHCAHHASLLSVHHDEAVAAPNPHNFLDMAFVYHVLSPHGICGQAKPLWDALEHQQELQETNPVIESLVSSIAEIMPFATSTRRIMSVPLSERDTTKDKENWVSPQAGDSSCTCSFCQPYHECFDLYCKYKDGNMDSLTSKKINSLDLSPIQLEFLEALQLSV